MDDPGTRIRIPRHLLPQDGRFGCGPSLIPAEHVHELVDSPLLGTSHRQPPVLRLVAELRDGLSELFDPPPGYLVTLGNGGTTSFWDAAAFSLVRRQARHGVFGEFSSKFAEVTRSAPFLSASVVDAAEPGSIALPRADGVSDILAWPHNETSTGAAAPVTRPSDTDEDTLVLVDATSAAGGLPVDLSQTDAYYFAPQKNFAADGGLWFAVLSPRALDRIAEIDASDRWIPSSLRLATAVELSAKNQTLNTPALSTLILMNAQVRTLLGRGGLSWAVERTAENARRLYQWVEERSYTTCFVRRPEERSQVVATVDLEPAIDATTVSKVLRAHGVVDTESYRKLGRNQLRIALFPSIDPDDISALTACIDHVVDELN
ncbi:phosphoserine aminotransferase apoenzyme [Austwickia chelonae]|uniref:phosphoserine transaminase n=1 Tax=Austwickia chelonae NBRC 105200 TaxID=1184607 RepID=K6UMA5_9MICO|nr:phosphoserine transaminase [Austwickia chelonae]GAB77941.1 phosphoserine aminotransferase [Austwickia chelonae NBRC 105200]SEV92705.1 phosphoserine aminotransferase apoenzyme [Austwickia chelonae]